MEFLAGDKAQSMYAEVNYEYPVKDGVKRSGTGWRLGGDFQARYISLDDIASHHEAAIKLLDEVKFDL